MIAGLIHAFARFELDTDRMELRAKAAAARCGAAACMSELLNCMMRRRDVMIL